MGKCFPRENRDYKIHPSEEKAQWLHSRLSINLIDHSLGFQVISQPVARKFACLLAFDKEDYRVALKMPQVK